MRNAVQSLYTYLHASALPTGAVVLRLPDDAWSFAPGNPELWRLSVGDESDANIPGQFFRPVQVDYWRNDGDLFTAEHVCDQVMVNLTFDKNPLSILQVPRYNWNNPSSPVFLNWMRLTLSQGWQRNPTQEPNTKMLRYVLSLNCEYSKYQ